MTHEAQWVAAAPLWDGAARDGDRLRRPALLRFASDSFMEDLAALLADSPAKLSRQVAKPESFRAEPVGADSGWQSKAAALKLYQPAHGHFYLVAASLTCKAAGLPDRKLETSAQERVGFVLRRKSGKGEMAWIADPVRAKGWKPVSGRLTHIVQGEEMLPLFPMSYTEDGRRRRIFAGLIPVSSREAYHAAPQLSPFEPEPTLDPRIDELHARVLQPLDDLKHIQSAATGAEVESSRFLLLDFMDFLQAQAKPFWDAINAETRPAGAAAGALYDLLENSGWRGMMATAWSERKIITGEEQGASTLATSLRNTTLTSGALEPAVKNVLGPYAPPAASSAATTDVPKLGAGDKYVLRCVYQRPCCPALLPDVVSDETEEFELASFFDPDAPARPIRISLPLDTSPSGLRKFRKGVAFLISDTLRKQAASVPGLEDLMKGKLETGGGPELGVICSFSIPIITICAFILLMIFVILLNIIFWWLPFFKICLPIRLKGKSA